MKKEYIKIEGIPAILWGETFDSVYIYVHGKMSSKEDAHAFAAQATAKGYQVLSFDLPAHGERKYEGDPCNVWNGMRDLDIIGRYAVRRWRDICLYGCSLGAFFSLLAYRKLPLRKCLFLSPILDMERLIQNMMKWANVTEQELKDKQEIATEMGETLSWAYYCYARENPIVQWDVPTAILCGSEDNLTEREVFERFSERFDCDLTVLDGGAHWFNAEWQLACLNQWLDERI